MNKSQLQKSCLNKEFLYPVPPDSPCINNLQVFLFGFRGGGFPFPFFFFFIHLRMSCRHSVCSLKPGLPPTVLIRPESGVSPRPAVVPSPPFSRISGLSLWLHHSLGRKPHPHLRLAVGGCASELSLEAGRAGLAPQTRPAHGGPRVWGSPGTVQPAHRRPAVGLLGPLAPSLGPPAP